MRILLFIFSMFIFFFLKAQETDSLRKFVNTTSDQSQKLEALTQLFEQEKYSNSETAEIYANKALAIAQQLNNVFEQGNINNKLGLFYANLSEFQKAHDYYNKALEFFRQIV